MKRRDLIPYDYRIFTGAILSDLQVDSYNRLQERINTFIDNNRKVPEELINGSFNLFNSYVINLKP